MGATLNIAIHTSHRRVVTGVKPGISGDSWKAFLYQEYEKIGTRTDYSSDSDSINCLVRAAGRSNPKWSTYFGRRGTSPMMFLIVQIKLI